MKPFKFAERLAPTNLLKTNISYELFSNQSYINIYIKDLVLNNQQKIMQ